MKLAMLAAPGFLAASAVVLAEPVELQGTICRASRRGDRLIVAEGKSLRHPVQVDGSAHVTFEGGRYDMDDLRPGDKIVLRGHRAPSGEITADRVDVQERVFGALVDSLLGIKPPLVGRFAAREAKTAFFSLNLPGDDYVRVDGRSWGSGAVGKLRSGDLVELSGRWNDKREFVCSYGRVLTDQEPGSCQRDARRGETKEETAARETAERRFLDGHAVDDEREEKATGEPETGEP